MTIFGQWVAPVFCYCEYVWQVTLQSIFFINNLVVICFVLHRVSPQASDNHTQYDKIFTFSHPSTYPLKTSCSSGGLPQFGTTGLQCINVLSWTNALLLSISWLSAVTSARFTLVTMAAYDSLALGLYLYIMYPVIQMSSALWFTYNCMCSYHSLSIHEVCHWQCDCYKALSSPLQAQTMWGDRSNWNFDSICQVVCLISNLVYCETVWYFMCMLFLIYYRGCVSSCDFLSFPQMSCKLQYWLLYYTWPEVYKF